LFESQKRTPEGKKKNNETGKGVTGFAQKRDCGEVKRSSCSPGEKKGYARDVRPGKAEGKGASQSPLMRKGFPAGRGFGGI